MLGYQVVPILGQEPKLGWTRRIYESIGEVDLSKNRPMRMKTANAIIEIMLEAITRMRLARIPPI